VARSSLKRPRLRCVSFRTTIEAEDAVAALFEKVLGCPATIYTNAVTGSTRVTAYCAPAVPFMSSGRTALDTGIQRLRDLGINTGSGRVQARWMESKEWAESWKRHFKPFVAGGILLIKPGWSTRKPARGESVMVLDPGLSFGTGRHPTTRFCLEEIAARRPVQSHRSLLDVGTGSGILAIAAAKLGYSPIHALDSDAVAVRVAKENARRNRVEHKIRFARRALEGCPTRSSRRYDVVCANLVYDILDVAASAIDAVVAPGSILILAGILRDQFPGLERRYTAFGYRLVKARTEGEWRSGTFAKLA
jgi:ribosomal protein L11 methyltransferase